MSFKFACPHCGQRISAATEDVGTTGGCPSCGNQFVVPAPSDSGPKTEAVPSTVRARAVTRPDSGAPEKAPEVPAVTKRGLAFFALFLSIFPGFNLVALGMAIAAVVRSDRPGRRGERGAAVLAVTVASLLVIPVNLLLPLAAYSVLGLQRSFVPPTLSSHESGSRTPRPAAPPALH
jgi:hypothetical protein